MTEKSKEDQQQQTSSSLYAIKEKFSNHILWNDIKEWITMGTNVWKTKKNEKQDYKEEIHIIRSLSKPLIWGISVTFITFCTFRFMGSTTYYKFTKSYNNMIYNIFHNNNTGNTGSSSSTRPQTKRKRTTTTVSLLEKKKKMNKTTTTLKHEHEHDLIQLPIDLFLSCIFGIWTTAFLMEPKEMATKIGRIPLVSGKSMISEISCHKWIEFYKNNNIALHHSKENNEFIEKDSILLTLHDFVKHCHVREKAKEIILQQQQQQHDDIFLDYDEEERTTDDEESTTNTEDDDVGSSNCISIPQEIMDQAMREVAEETAHDDGGDGLSIANNNG